MISEIDFSGISESKNFSYAEKLEYFQKNKKVEFKPGLNIIFAPNGAGKSTLLKIAAQFTACEQGGVSTITHTWTTEVEGINGTNLKGLDVKHDGQPVMYTNPRQAVGLFGGMAAFDDDFFNEGIAEVQLRESTGYTTMARLNKILQVINGQKDFPTEIVKKHKAGDKFTKLLEASIPVGQKTIMIDEPESGLAIHAQSKLWDMINKAAKEKDLQIIVATHSPFALTCRANFIELQPGYLEIAKSYIIETAQILELQQKIKEMENKAAQESPEIEHEHKTYERPAKTKSLKK
jgi:predicted ATPase